MDPFGFTVNEHVLPCQHIRGYRNAAKDNPAALRFVIKEYTPKNDQHSPEAGGVTIIAAHANGIPKEAYEPLWEELRSRLGGLLSSIWIADCSHQGASGVLNEGLQGDDPNWFDHSRDLLIMVNHFRDRIRPPVIGVAHSMGCVQLTQLSIMHPRLFQGLVLIEPVMLTDLPPGPNASSLTSYKPDLWRSQEEAHAYFRTNKFYKSWDRRALDLYLRYGLRHTPTLIYPEAMPGSVTLTTTKHQEAWSYLRSNFTSMPPEGQADQTERLTSGDLDPHQATYLFHRAEPGIALKSLPSLQPHVLWVFAERSYLNRPKDRELKVSLTGRDARINGGLAAGAVEMRVVDKAGHLVPLERIAETADAIAPFLRKQLVNYEQEEAFWLGFDSGKSERDKLVLSQQWMKEVRKKADEKRTVRPKSKM